MFTINSSRVKQLQERISDKLIRLQRKRVVSIVRKTIYALFPFILLGSIIQVISVAVFTDIGFAGLIFATPSWIPHYSIVGIFFSNLTLFTLGLVGLLTTYYAAYYTAESYNKNKSLAAIIAVISYLIIASQTWFNRRSEGIFFINLNSFGSANLLWGLFIGYMVGLIFRLMDSQTEHIEDKQIRTNHSLRAIFLSIFLASGMSAILALANRYGMFTYLSSMIEELTVASNTFWGTLWNASLTTFSAWLGMTDPFVQKNFTDDVFFSENLSYVLTNHTTTSIPYPFTETTLYHSFANVGGVGALFSLVLALVLFSKSPQQRKIGWLSFFPTFFNNGTSVMTGLPLLLNPLYLPPFLLAPLTNIVLAAFALHFNLLTPTVYPVPLGTPSTLFAFIGSGGDVKVLVFAVVCLLLNSFIYLPFIRFDEKIQTRISLEREEIK